MNTQYDAVVFDHWPAQDPVLKECEFDRAMLSLGGKTMLERVIARLADLGCKNLLLVLGDFPATHRDFVGDGTRWGVSVSYTFACGQGAPLRLVAKMLENQQGQIVLACSDTLIHEQDVLEENHVSCYLDEGLVCWSGWARLPATEAATLMKTAGSRAELEECMISDHNLCRYKDHLPLSSSTASDMINLPHQIFQHHLLDRQHSVSQRLSFIAADAHIIQPVLIGQNVFIGSGCEIGPNVIIEDNCIINPCCQIRHTSIAAGTYLGQGLLVQNAHVTDSAILKADHQVYIPKNDHEILGPVANLPAGNIPLSERCASIALWLATTPASLYYKYLSRDQLPPKLTKLVKLQEKLPEVFRGEIALFGLTQRAGDELAKLPVEWQTLYQEHRMGILNETIFLPETDMLDETVFFADIKSTRRSSIREKYRIISYFFSGVWGTRAGSSSA